MIPAHLIERAKSVRLEDELSRCGVRLKGRGKERAGPCLICGGHDRFSINIRKQVWNCRGCNKGGDVIQLIQHIHGVSFPAAIDILTGGAAPKVPIAKPDIAINHGDETQRLAQAQRLFEQAEPLGPAAIAYFERRKIDINAVPDHGGLRWHPKCPFEGESKPCVIARYTDVITSAPHGIWRRPIDGSSKPKALGPTAGCVIRLWPDDAVTLGLVLGEGIETTLAAATRIVHDNTLLQAAWAAGFAGNMRTFPVLAGIEVLTLLVDHDSNGSGQEAAQKCAARWTAAGREVEFLIPDQQNHDFNDVTRGGQS